MFNKNLLNEFDEDTIFELGGTGRDRDIDY